MSDSAEATKNMNPQPAIKPVGEGPKEQTPAGAASQPGEQPNIDILMDVSLQVAVELGRTRMSVRQLLELQNGSVVELDRAAGDAVDIYVNDHMLARGEVVVVDDKFGVRITQVISPKRKTGE